ncbi:hypothetical protein EB796_001483 [Bugula neritina]|uniref:Uncharacterized protein n=1 Tax=Bugula neritina TaxID=10212 RepID=A0A7J7KPW2_BUGNE|nr:hypothetical protein EB796_001483 [Bugula neritina]
MAVTMFKTAGDVVNLTVLKDAERKIVEATYQTVNPKTQSNSVEMLLLGLGATVLVGFVLYKCRNSVKTVISRVFPSHSDKYAGFTYRPYR